MDERLIAAMQASIARTDELHAQHIALLEKTVAGMHEALCDLANAAMRLAGIRAPRDPADAEVIGDVVARASRVLEHLAPTAH